MRNYVAFLSKEMRESILTYKSVILVAVFLIFGITNPLIAKLTPEIIQMLGTDGIAITVPDPVALDSWMQFFKNVSQMGLIVLVILFSGILATEINKGTLINMLTKGLSRTTVVLAKYSMMLIVWTIAYGICFGVTFGYTMYLFPETTTDNLGFALVGLWLFGVLLLSIIMCAASFTANNYACLLATALSVGALMVINIIPAAHDFNPFSLASDSMALISGALAPSDLIPAIVITIVASSTLLIIAVLVFRKRQL